MMFDKEQELNDLWQAAQSGTISRRDLIRRGLALGLGVPTIGVLLAACGSSKSTPTAATQATSAPAGTTPTTSAAATSAATATSGAAAASPSAAASVAASTSSGSLSFDCGTTGGGGGQANTALAGYCYVVGGGSMFEVRRCVDSRLFAWKPDLSDYIPELAQKWDIDQTKMTITFHLQPNAKWHDGQALTSDDVLFTFNLLANPATGSRYEGAFANVHGYSDVKDGGATTLSGITAPDSHTVVMQLDKLDAGLLPQIPDMDILPKHVVGSTAPAKICESQFWIDNTQRVGAGPYKWSQRVADQRIELEAFSDYFLGAPKIAKVNLLLFSSYETSLAAFAQQSSYAAPLTVDNLSYAKGLSFGDVSTQSSGVLILEVNTYLKDVPLLGDKRVRQAISYAIDRKTIASQLYKNVAAVPTYWTTPWLAWSKSSNLNTYDYNVDKAKSLMKAAGWSSTRQFTLWYYYTDQVTASVVEAIAQYLAAIGINAKPRLNSGGDMSAAVKAGTWEFVYGAWGLNPALNMSQVWNCQSTLKYCNSQFDNLMNQARSTLDQTKQRDLLKQAVQILNDELPTIWLFNRQNIVVSNKKLNTNGHQAWATGSLMYHNYIEDWTLTS